MKIPHTLVLLYLIVLVAYCLTWILPAGQFETELTDAGSEIIIPGTFSLLESADHLPISHIFTVIPRGLAAAQGIIFFVLIIGGALAVVKSTGAIDAGIGRLLIRFSDQPAHLIFVLMLVFATGASTFGMAEERIPLVLIIVGLCVALRMDAIVGAAILLVAGSVGYGVAAINPFTLVTAQIIAGLPPISGLLFRLIVFVPLFLLGFLHVWRYARRIRRDPTLSLLPRGHEPQVFALDLEAKMSRQHWMVLLIVFAAVGLLVWGASVRGWYLVEYSAIFVGVTVLVGVIARKPANDVAVEFTRGAAELSGTALIIGVARSIQIVLSDGQVLDTIIYGLSTPLSYVGTELSAVGMFFTQTLLNFFIPSGSGQAFATMPIMGPVADVVGIERQVAVLAFLMGDGLSNMIIPTSATLMAILSIAGIPYSTWFRFIWPLMLQFTLVACLVMVIAVITGYR